MVNTTQGLASYTSSEMAELVSIYQAGGGSDAYKVISALLASANKWLTVAPKASTNVVTSGASVQTGTSANTGTVSTQAAHAYDLATAYEITSNSKYLTQAKNYLLTWAKTNIPSGDSIANAAFLDMFKAYDLIQNKFSSSERGVMTHWMNGIADALIAGQAKAEASGSMIATNNHHSYELLEVGTIGAVLGNSKYIHVLTDGFLKHIGVNLQSFAGEPPYMGLDYHERHAVHYVAYNLEALGQAAILMDQLSHLTNNPYDINYNPFTAQVNGASIQNTLNALLPYASGELTSTHEFQGSMDSNDAQRIANGTLSSTFDPTDAIPALEAADYFGHTVNDSLNGHSYSLSQLTGSILTQDGKTPISSTMPDAAFLQNSIISPYDAPSVTVKVATDSGVHTYDAGVANETFTFYKYTGQTVIKNFVSGSDVLNISAKIYATADQALSHVHYQNGNAVLALDGTNNITIVGAESHPLTVHDFHVFN